MSITQRGSTVLPTNHRTRTGQARRAQTQQRIISAALEVFAARGPDAPIIDDFIRAAGVSRGTFYNYYRSTGELLEATTKWLGDDLMESIEGEIGGLTDPITRLTTGLRLWLRMSESDPLWCAFTVRASDVGGLVKEKLGGDLRNGRRRGLLDFPSLDSAYDLVVGTVRESMRRIIARRPRRNHDVEVVRIILRGLGLAPAAIEQALARPVPRLRREPRGVGRRVSTLFARKGRARNSVG
ncbi:MAG TPA: TetR/AcrR family transcriptional regulator [Steroidobacteraceae bacterium]|nr:TetR/AcrR family transcriptional regulator [Steroidobacteraceae bacterium]